MAIRPVRTQHRDQRSSYHGRRMSVATYLSLPEEKPYLEYVDGVVLQKPMPNAAHGTLAAEIAFVLGTYARAGRGGRVRVEARAAAGPGPDYRIPDVSYWAPGRPSGDDSIPPLAVEVRSPNQPLPDLRAKCRLYRQHGIDASWLIDPESRTVEVFEADYDGVALPESDTLTSAQLPGFELPLKQLFAALDSE